MIEWERQIIHNMILVCDIYIYVYKYRCYWITFFHSVSLPGRDLYDILTEQVMVNCERVPDLVVTKAQCICTTAPGTSWHRRWKRSSYPSMTTYRSQWDRWGWMISMVRGFTYAEKKTGFFLQSGGFHAVLHGFATHNNIIGGHIPGWDVREDVHESTGLSLASCSTGCSGLGFWRQEWFSTIPLTWWGVLYDYITKASR